MRHDGGVTASTARHREELSPSEAEWLAVRRHLLARRYELGRTAADAYPSIPRVPGTPLLTAAHWLPAEPLPLNDLRLRLTTAPVPPGVDGGEGDEITRPTRRDRRQYPTYAHAMRELEGRRFQNRGTYRLLDADLQTGEMRLGLGRYADGLDVGEAAGHEFAATDLWPDRSPRMPLRRAVGDPRDLTGRPANVAISALTLRRDTATGSASFLLHWRDPSKVGHAGGLYQVVPVGMFQASGEEPWNVDNDFSLWRCLTREYAEELLGEAEDYDNANGPIDYAAWPFAADLNAAKWSGTVRAYCLGLGVDPLTFATDLLVAVVIDAEAYDDLFGAAVVLNDEGRVLRALEGLTPGAHGLRFDEHTIGRFASDEPMQAAGAAVLSRAWECRDLLLR